MNDTSMNNSQFSLANRKHLADMLDDRYNGLRYKAKQKYQERESELERKLVVEYGEKKGAAKVAAQINATREKLHELELDLKSLGFEMENGGRLGLDGYGTPLHKLIDERVQKELGTRADIDARFDSAQIAMMTVASLEDADKLLKSVAAI
jgi:hypothetical protein